MGERTGWLTRRHGEVRPAVLDKVSAGTWFCILGYVLCLQVGHV